jgi:aspartate/methionine/tyrosine aminotransferase
MTATRPDAASSLFADEQVPLDLLRARAFNLRWAQQPPEVIPLTAADPDYPVAEPIRDAIARYARDGVLSYAPPEGLPMFREAVARWLCEQKGMRCAAEHIFATDSVAAGMAVIARACLQPGDEALIFDPVDFLFQTSIEMAGAVAVRIPLQPDTGIEALLAALEAARTPRTRMLWLCNPHNPLGKVFDRDSLMAMAQWALRHGLRIVADEIWSDIVYPPAVHCSVASLSDDIAASTLTVYGFSKNFAMAGLRIGCIVCSDGALMERLVDVSGARTTVFGASVLSQVAAVAAVTECEPWLRAFLVHLESQRDLLVEHVKRWPGAVLVPPQGTFVAFPDISAWGLEPEAVCALLRERARVALVPGAPRWFGPGARGHVRICFSTSRGLLSEALQRMAPVVEELANSPLKRPA